MSTHSYREQDLTKPRPTNAGIVALSFTLATLITLLAWLGADVALDRLGF